jgi:outer membrane autotransporter protein
MFNLSLPAVCAQPGYEKKNNVKVDLTVGGAGGKASDGGLVTVINRGGIKTAGEKSHGIFAQSIGGGGGTGGNANIGIAFKIGFGGAGGSGGDGGKVTVENSAAISTLQDGAHGIFAQSVGKGGGIAGNVVRTVEIPVVGYKVPRTESFGLGAGIGGQGAGHSDGGQVTVSNTGNITTRGTGAYGIFAQSVGGGGGLGGIDTDAMGYLIFNGSVFHGGDGVGGQVTVTSSGDITTQGESSHGIVAQSTAGSANDVKAGKVDVTVTGNITASGYASHGIQAQSLGAKESSDISVTVSTNRTVQGGRDSGSSYSYGVLLMDGANNILTNGGHISTLSGVNGTAIMQQGSYGAASRGNLTINNYGTITGSVNQGGQAASDFTKDMSLAAGTSTINFNNGERATFISGRIINLGAGTLNNSGTVNLGGGTAIQSNLTGNFVQTATGILQTLVNSDGTCGSLNISGRATLDGTLRVEKGAGILRDGTKYNILQAAGGINGNFSTVVLPQSTALVSYSTQRVVQVGAAGQLTAAAAGQALNEYQVVSHVKGLASLAKSPLEDALAQFDENFLSTASDDLLAIIEVLQSLQPGDFNDVFNSLSPDVYAANTITTFNITRQYIRTLQRRLQNVRQNLALAGTGSQALASKPILLAYNGSNQRLGQFLGGSQDEVLRRKFGFWLEGFGQFGNQGSADGFSGFNFGTAGTAAGLDFALTERLTLGANFGYSYTSMTLDNDFGAGRINSLYGSLYGTYYGPRSYLGGIPYLEGIFCYGHHDYKNNRLIRIGPFQGGADSTHQGNSFSVFMEGGYAVPVQQWSVQPFASLLYTHLDEGGIQETGADVLNMQIDARQTNSVVSELGLRVARPIKTSKGILIPEVKAAWQHDFAVDKRTMPITFASVPIGFSIDGPKLVQDSATVSAALSFTSKGGITTTLKYDGEFRSGYTSHGVLGEVRLSF